MLSRTLLLLLVVGALACATPMPESLAGARRAVGELERDADAKRYAAVSVREARQALERADDSWAEEADPDEAEHLSYLVRGRVAIARSAAEGAKSLERAEQLTRERDKVRLEARTEEAEAARGAAETRALEAEAARAQADVARRESDAARSEAEKQRGEAEAARREVEAATAREEKLRREVEELQARETERGLIMTLGDVLFDLDKATLKPGAMTRLDRLAGFLQSYPERSLLIEGHTDATGSDAYNQELSQRRADAVAGHLAGKGIDPGRLLARGYGKAYPVAGNETAPGRQQNRRVEIVILESGEDPADKMRP